jgi:hypothetical protein
VSGRERYQATASDAADGHRLAALSRELGWAIGRWPALRPELAAAKEMVDAQGLPDDGEPDDCDLIVTALERADAATGGDAGLTLSELEKATGITVRSALIDALSGLRNEVRVRQRYDGRVGVVRWYLVKETARR